MRPESRNIATVSRQPARSAQFTDGIYSRPFSIDGYAIFSLGQNPRFMASENMVNDPLNNAWLAMIAAPVDMITPISVNPEGMMA